MMRPAFGRIVECVEILSSRPDGFSKFNSFPLPPVWIAKAKKRTAPAFAGAVFCPVRIRCPGFCSRKCQHIRRRTALFRVSSCGGLILLRIRLSICLHCPQIFLRILGSSHSRFVFPKSNGLRTRICCAHGTFLPL